MLRHAISRRTPQHNLRLATLLGLTAGFVNAAGFLGFSVLTTNVTGHAALFAESLAMQDWQMAKVIALWMLSFLAGAFTSALILSITGLNQRFSYSLPVIIEIIVLTVVAFIGGQYAVSPGSKVLFAGSLLFAMGLQNSLVTVISGSVVRTTHLTGTFTDLGIELAQYINKKQADKDNLLSKIKLRLYLIIFFMAGAVAGAYLFYEFHFICFLLPVAILVLILLYDIFRIKAKRYFRQPHTIPHH